MNFTQELLLKTQREALNPESRQNKFSIELDCSPGNPRPDDLIEGVLLNTGLSKADFDPPAKFFGNYRYILKADPIKDALFLKNKPVFKERITKLYNAGIIRYGSW